jgi:hypothetical protein
VTTFQAIPARTEPALDAAPPRHPVNFRSVGVGLLGVVYICGLAPFNDYVMNNGVFVGGSLPVSVVLFLAIFQLCVNGPLSVFAPRMAFSTGELVTVLSMMLVCCVIPTSGLMRFWPATLMGPWYYRAFEPGYDDVFKAVDLPSWYFPTFKTADPLGRAADPMLTTFYNGTISSGAVGWADVARAWLPPLLGWGVFFGALGMCLLGLSFVCARQWIENERIQFPIAQVQASLVEEPRPGRWLSESLSARSFWVAVALVLTLRLMDGVKLYYPNVPRIELAYNLRSLFPNPPLSYIEGHITLQTIWPIVIGLTYFVAMRVSFSLWLFIVLVQPPLVLLEAQAMKPGGGDLRSLQLGSVIAFLAMIVWTGRQHYWGTIRQMIGLNRADGATGRFVNFGVAGWMAAVGFAVAVAWLAALKATPLGALALVGGIVAIWVVMANVVAHSGLMMPTILGGPREWFLTSFGNADFKANYNVGDVRNQFHMQMVGGMFATASDQLMVYGTHATKVAHDQAPGVGRRLIVAMVLALVVGYGVGAASNVFAYYRFSKSLDSKQDSPINKEVLLDGQPKWAMDHTLKTHRNGAYTPANTKPMWPWVLGGTVATGALAWLQLTVAWWPLHPIGLLMVFSFPLRRIWFSIFLGWLVKSLIVRFGGQRLFLSARPFFLGLILGDVIAQGLFGLSGIALMAMGQEYKSASFLPVSQF